MVATTPQAIIYPDGPVIDPASRHCTGAGCQVQYPDRSRQPGTGADQNQEIYRQQHPYRKEEMQGVSVPASVHNNKTVEQILNDLLARTNFVIEKEAWPGSLKRTG